MARFYDAPPWRFVIQNLSGSTLTFLDRLASGRSVRYTLNAPAVATMSVPADNPEVNIAAADGDPFVAANNRLLFGFQREAGATVWVCRFGGILMQPNDEVSISSDAPVTHINAYDPWEYLLSRPCLNDLGQLPGANYSITDKGSNIAKKLLLNAIAGAQPGTPTAAANCFIDAGQGGAPGGGAYYGGTVDTSMASITMPITQGMSVGEAWTWLANSGNVDIYLKPIYDPVHRPGLIAEFNAFAQMGSQKPGALFSWDMPGRSLIGVNRLEDGEQMVNVGQGYEGAGGAPRPRTSGVQTNVASLAKYGDYWLQKFFTSETATGPLIDLIMAGYVQLQASGKVSLTLDASPEFAPVPWADYWLGDSVPVYVSKHFRKALNPKLVGGAWTNFQRIYEIPLVIPDDAPAQVQQLLVTGPYA